MKYIKSAGCFSLLYVILYFLLSMGMGIFVTNTYLFTTLFYLILWIAALIYLKICGENAFTSLRIRPIHIGSFFLVILLAFTIRPVAGFITLVANLFFKDVTTNTMTQKVLNNLGLSIFTTAFLPGLVEETIFRGVLYSRLRKSNPIKAILLSSLFFGIAHMNFQQFCYAFFLGIIFGFLVEATDSIFSSMTAHMVFNGSSILLTYFMSNITFENNVSTSSTNVTDVSMILASLPLAFIGLILSILIIVLIAHLNGRLEYIKTWFRKSNQELWPKEKAANFSFFAALLICFIFAMWMEVASRIV